MGRYTGPKRRLSRREGVAIFAKDAAYIERKGAVAPGQHGARSRRRISEFGVQLREKQKAKRTYGLLEKQFARYYQMASKKVGNTGEVLMQLLETRLDNVVYRLGLASSRAAARQLVSHGHILVDNKKVNIPSFQVKTGSTVAISHKMLDNTQVKKNLTIAQTLPEWLDRKAIVGKVLRLPKRDEAEQGISEQLIVEYYSR
ncbi:MAG: 30S ribosomal protein S4 [Candidatus Daviesbacteria bacterium GW2011_GWA1_41_61]|uniref:Small ribosomal subunit protein uS4 n=1 Tax=Candidatus Daviesbacteria bacterium GW2011_GWA2_40_9 TaxID=1618424 RepID=A0A0G0X3D1_9BACT|nr:MAG: 30S ribosomal protein S4 [Candidatus Daviesbacteria bacterium GW2011_GWC1_40_9]KKR82092.1 MAG: 30S ribosomal protein S4 [Candidatus Daviesbacteria bacterium GW2011_GWA2_40_9]KKR93275.1 MAG: 30S ribosomal protein S4 [Candidatus Daviesbacteria bacterium GW2011_GWB1_41_15]KKS14763.1 MAG: 30S ribosomal protein S4 [Candidatus Daviesbacteria bacterium GW2011_GWA1_41_61]